jgi:hypothetical protein
LGAAFGLSSADVDRSWLELVEGQTSDWALCSGCLALAARYRGQPDTNASIHADPMTAAPPPASMPPSIGATAPPPNPVQAAEVVARILRELRTNALVPADVLPFFRIMQEKSEQHFKWVNRLSSVVAFASLAAAIGFGVTRSSIWIALGAFAGTILLGAVVAMLGSLAARRRIRALSQSRGVPPADGLALFDAVGRERRLFKVMTEAAKSLGQYQLSEKLDVRLFEALMLTLIGTRIVSVLAPTRDVAAKREEFKLLKETSTGAKKHWTPLLGKCNVITAAAEAILDNRDRMFTTIDRIASAL